MEMNFSRQFLHYFLSDITQCNINDQTCFSDTLTSAGNPREGLKPSPFRLGFQNLPRGPADVNAQKTMFDLYIDWTLMVAMVTENGRINRLK